MNWNKKRRKTANTFIKLWKVDSCKLILAWYVNFNYFFYQFRKMFLSKMVNFQLEQPKLIRWLISPSTWICAFQVPVVNGLPVSYPAPVPSPLSKSLSTQPQVAEPSNRPKKRVTVTVLKEPPAKKQCCWIISKRIVFENIDPEPALYYFSGQEVQIHLQIEPILNNWNFELHHIWFFIILKRL